MIMRLHLGACTAYLTVAICMPSPNASALSALSVQSLIQGNSQAASSSICLGDICRFSHSALQEPRRSQQELHNCGDLPIFTSSRPLWRHINYAFTQQGQELATCYTLMLTTTLPATYALYVTPENFRNLIAHRSRRLITCSNSG
jgi:hypothetical protein